MCLIFREGKSLLSLPVTMKVSSISEESWRKQHIVDGLMGCYSSPSHAHFCRIVPGLYTASFLSALPTLLGMLETVGVDITTAPLHEIRVVCSSFTLLHRPRELSGASWEMTPSVFYVCWRFCSVIFRYSGA